MLTLGRSVFKKGGGGKKERKKEKNMFKSQVMEMHQRSSDEIDFEGDGGVALLRRSGLRRRLSFRLLAHPGGAAAPASSAFNAFNRPQL